MAGLRALAEIDLGRILEDDLGFAWPISITDPDGVTVPDLKGFSTDVSQVIDPDTGQMVSGRVASIALRIGLLTDNGLGLPTGITDQTVKPWLVAFDDIYGNPYTFKVQKSNPDRAIGIVTCLLEAYSA